jgi:GT2 family glycosyltransferase
MNKISQPRTAVVIVNWNKKDFLMQLIESLGSLNYKNYDVIVVDNASTDSSVKLLSETYPEITIIQNAINLGGTGGFNTGIRYVMDNNSYKYVWLLDNDALVENDTLRQLIRVMERDDKIGIAGSMIVDSDDRDLIVELGGFLRWDTIGVTPNQRNTRIGANLEPTEVEYVAICSALVRVDAVKKIGLMDERFFLFWDDMDWGLSFKKYGFKIVAVPASVVYHPAFTEKERGEVTDFYYGHRNGLLVYTKHTGFWRRLFIFWNSLRTSCTEITFYLFTRQRESACLMIQAIRDFTNNKWGKIRDGHKDRKNIFTINKKIFSDDQVKISKILISTLGATREDVLLMIEELRTMYPNAEITLLLKDDRREVFEMAELELVVVSAKMITHIFYKVYAFFRLVRKKYDVILGTSRSVYFFAVKKSAVFNEKERIFLEDERNIATLFTVMIATFVGQLIGAMILPVILLKGNKYRRTEKG